VIPMLILKVMLIVILFCSKKFCNRLSLIRMNSELAYTKKSFTTMHTLDLEIKI